MSGCVSGHGVYLLAAFNLTQIIVIVWKTQNPMKIKENSPGIYFVSSGWKLSNVIFIFTHNNNGNNSQKVCTLLLVNVLSKNTTEIFWEYQRSGVKNNPPSQLLITFHQLPFPCLDLKLKAVGPHIHVHIHVASVALVKMKSEPSQWCTGWIMNYFIFMQSISNYHITNVRLNIPDVP